MNETADDAFRTPSRVAWLTRACILRLIYTIAINCWHKQSFSTEDSLHLPQPHYLWAYFHRMWFLEAFDISPTPSRTFVMSYILRFWTCSVSAASFKSSTPSGDACSRSLNFLVNAPNDVSGLLSDVGDTNVNPGYGKVGGEGGDTTYTYKTNPLSPTSSDAEHELSLLRTDLVLAPSISSFLFACQKGGQRNTRERNHSMIPAVRAHTFHLLQNRDLPERIHYHCYADPWVCFRHQSCGRCWTILGF